MKFKLEKDCVGLKKGEDINIAEDKIKRMTELGYIKPIEAKSVKTSAKKNKS